MQERIGWALRFDHVSLLLVRGVYQIIYSNEFVEILHAMVLQDL